MARRFSMAGAGLAAFVALLLLVSACGGGGMFDMGEMDEQMHGGGSRAPQTPVVADAAQITVEIRDFDFLPRDLTVKLGTEVTWVNRDSVPHDATDEAGGWGTGMLKGGESAALTFDLTGTYRYLCTIHADMKATLTVVYGRAARIIDSPNLETLEISGGGAHGHRDEVRPVQEALHPL